MSSRVMKEVDRILERIPEGDVFHHADIYEACRGRYATCCSVTWCLHHHPSVVVLGKDEKNRQTYQKVSP